jgi:hypothetical protein
MGYLSGSCPVSVLLQPYRVLLVVPGDIFPEGFKPVTEALASPGFGSAGREKPATSLYGLSRWVPTGCTSGIWL